MVLVVVLVHAVVADQEEIGKPVEIAADDIEAVVATEIGGIGLGHADNVGVFDIRGLEDADLGDFSNGKTRHLLIRKFPQIVRLVAKYSRPIQTLSAALTR